MTIPTTGIDETSPAGSQKLNLGDNRIREYKVQNREILEIDHNYPSTGQDADAGKHKKVSLLEQADIGTGASTKPILGGQTYGGKPELTFTDEDDNDVILTSQGKMGHSTTNAVTNDLSVVGDLTVTGTAFLKTIYPIGIVITLGVSTNPATLFGFGTWSAIAGRVIVGIDAGQTEFDTLDETGGAKTHTLTTDEIPAHTHTIDLGFAGSDGTNTRGDSGTGEGPDTTSSTGGGSAHNNLQPYIIKYIWQRTA